MFSNLAVSKHALRKSLTPTICPMSGSRKWPTAIPTFRRMPFLREATQCKSSIMSASTARKTAS